jgi:4-carboxymuconolactone decarboxylase
MKSRRPVCAAASFVLLAALGSSRAAVAQERLPSIPAGQLTPEQRQAVAEFRSARSAEPTGPFIPMLRSPEVMTRARALGDYLRYKTRLEPRLSEFVILIASRSWSQQYEWAVHYPIAIKAGVGAEVARAIADRRRPSGMTAEQTTLYDFCDELIRTQHVGDAAYGRMVATFGEAGVVDTVGILGYYTMLAMMLNTARVPAPENGAPPLPTDRRD